jgi:cytoskeletal protein CcmA (bactofilin family)
MKFPAIKFLNQYPMFSKKENQPEKKSLNSATLISAGTVLHGDVNSENDLRIDGTIFGNVNCTAKIVVGPSGMIEGNINGLQADITGKVVGNIAVSETIQLRTKSFVQGNITGATLQVESSAVFNGQCQMGVVANVVQMTDTDVLAKAQ